MKYTKNIKKINKTHYGVGITTSVLEKNTWIPN